VLFVRLGKLNRFGFWAFVQLDSQASLDYLAHCVRSTRRRQNYQTINR